jgi:hypothetical protein
MQTFTDTHLVDTTACGRAPPVATELLSSPTTFLGVLTIIVTPRNPLLEISFLCPFCRARHEHSWSLFAFEPTHRTAHCLRPRKRPGGKRNHLLDTGYYVFPRNTRENLATLAQYARLTGEKVSTRELELMLVAA